MSRVLNPRERKALETLSFYHRNFLIKGELVGIGAKTLESLVGLGLAEVGQSERNYGQTGWRITPDGWRCMCGNTYEEIMAPGGKPMLPLKVWRWPPDENGHR